MRTRTTQRMVSLSVLIPILGFLAAGARPSFAAAPVLYFTDLASGPRTGNTDVSGGRVSGRDGAIVTVWGVNLGTARGSSKVVCNGAEAASYYQWTTAKKPADLSAFHKMQMISFQLSHLAKDGAGTVSVVVDGVSSNALPFMVRPGGIFFAATGGSDDSGDGSWSRPWRTIVKAAASLSPGDTAYIGDGVAQTTESDVSAAVNLPESGLKGKPMALVAYPGATVKVGNTNLERAFWAYNWDRDAFTKYWVVAKFTITAGSVGVLSQEGFRVVGNALTAPTGDGMDGVINVEGKDVVVLGNELTKVGILGCSKLYHGIYAKGVRKDDPPRAAIESNREIAWNYIHDNLCNRGINVYNEQAYAAFLERHRIHDNVIVNQRGDGIMLGYMVTGKNWVYNNVIIRAGLGPEWTDEASYHTGIRINTGHEQRRTAIVYCYNNTLYACGWSGADDPNTSGHLLIGPEGLSVGTKVDLRNNIIRSTGQPYVAGESGVLPSSGYRNCWYGKGAAPAWDTTPLAANPQFVAAGQKNLQLGPHSPCIDTGIRLTAVARDLLGRRRPQGAAFDLGAYEYVSGTGNAKR